MRYLTVVHGASTARYRTPRATILVIAAIWIALSLLNSPVVASYSVRPRGPSALPDCDINSNETGRRLFATFFAFGYALPLVVIGAFSVRVLVDIRRQRTCASAGVRRTKSFRRKQAVGRLLVLVVALFAVLWLPVHVHLLVAYFGNISTDRWYLVRIVSFHSNASDRSHRRRSTDQIARIRQEASLCTMGTLQRGPGGPWPTKNFGWVDSVISSNFCRHQ